MTRPVARLLVAVLSAAGCSSPRVAPAVVDAGHSCAGPGCVEPPDCAGWLKLGNTSDGLYRIDPDGAGPNPSFEVYCDGMGGSDGGTPREYLELAGITTPGAVDDSLIESQDPALTRFNFTVYQGGGSCPCGGNAILAFHRVRIDPDPRGIEIITDDDRFALRSPATGCFAKNAGKCPYYHGYAEPGDCVGPASLHGEAQIDLRGTPFYLAPTAYWDTWSDAVAPAFTVSLAADRRVATLRAGGACASALARGKSHRLPISFVPNPSPLPFVPALSNGNFDKRLSGWSESGGAAQFRVRPEPRLGSRNVVETGDAARGELTQKFIVPATATKLLWAVSGTGGHVEIRDQDGDPLFSCARTKAAPPTVFTPCIFNLSPHTGEPLEIAVIDDSPETHLITSGFEVMRGDAPTMVKNPSWVREGFKGWIVDPWIEKSLDHQWLDHEWAIISFDMAGRGLDAPVGDVFQCFNVTDAAAGLRFSMIGGGQTVELFDLGEPDAECRRPAGKPLYSAAGPSSNGYLVAYSWDLSHLRNHSVLLRAHDGSSVGWGWFHVREIKEVSSVSGP